MKQAVYVGGNEALSKMVQEKAFSLGYGWSFDRKGLKHTGANYLFFGSYEKYGITYSGYIDSHDKKYLIDVADFLNEEKPKKTITIDGKDIELSEESFQSLREQLVEGS